jgi:hypothetical protein
MNKLSDFLQDVQRRISEGEIEKFAVRAAESCPICHGSGLMTFSAKWVEQQRDYQVVRSRTDSRDWKMESLQPELQNRKIVIECPHEKPLVIARIRRLYARYYPHLWLTIDIQTTRT